jgi:hypothetical protein
MVYAFLFVVLYFFQPESIINRPLAALTLQAILNSGLWLGAALLLLRWLFSPSDHPETRDLWGYLGILMIVNGLGTSCICIGLDGLDHPHFAGVAHAIG